MAKKLNGTVIVTYRCNAKCTMCNRYKEPSRPEEEISLETIKKLPEMYFTNITGGEPFIRTDLKEIVKAEDLDFLSQSAFDDACRPGNPRDTSVEEITQLYKSLI